MDPSQTRLDGPRTDLCRRSCRVISGPFPVNARQRPPRDTRRDVATSLLERVVSEGDDGKVAFENWKAGSQILRRLVIIGFIERSFGPFDLANRSVDDQPSFLSAIQLFVIEPDKRLNKRALERLRDLLGEAVDEVSLLDQTSRRGSQEPKRLSPCRSQRRKAFPLACGCCSSVPSFSMELQTPLSAPRQKRVCQFRF